MNDKKPDTRGIYLLISLVCIILIVDVSFFVIYNSSNTDLYKEEDLSVSNNIEDPVSEDNVIPTVNNSIIYSSSSSSKGSSKSSKSSDDSDGFDEVSDSKITEEQAREIAKNEIDGEVIRVDLEKEGDKEYYAVEIDAGNGLKVDVLVDILDGKVLGIRP